MLGGNYLGDDDIKALARMPFADTIQVLDVSSINSRITTFPTSAFPCLEILWLGGSKLASFDAIEPSESLEWLELSLVGIQTIDRDDLARFPNIIKLDVSSNKISEILDLTSLEGQWQEKMKRLEEKPLSMMAERRWVGSCPMFILDINNNPINKIDPRTLAFFKTRMADGSIKIFCDDVVREMIERT